MKKTSLLLFSTLFYLCSYGQKQNDAVPTVYLSFNFKQLKGGWQKYKVDTNIKDSIPKSIIVRGAPSLKLTKWQSFDDKRFMEKEGFSAFVNFVSGDTTNIILTQSGDVGYRLIIVADSCKAFSYACSKIVDPSAGYKLNEIDTSYQTELLVPLTSYNLILTKKPSFLPGEIIEGHIECEGPTYYLKSSLPFKKMQSSIDGYFRTFDIKKIKNAQELPTWFVH